VSHAFYYDVPGDEAMYRQVKDRIGDEVAHGLVVQVVTRIEGGLRHLDVWQSREHWQRYQRERVGPAVGAVLATAGIPPHGAPPVEHELDLVHLDVGQHAEPQRAL